MTSTWLTRQVIVGLLFILYGINTLCFFIESRRTSRHESMSEQPHVTLYNKDWPDGHAWSIPLRENPLTLRERFWTSKPVPGQSQECLEHFDSGLVDYWNKQSKPFCESTQSAQADLRTSLHCRVMEQKHLPPATR